MLCNIVNRLFSRKKQMASCDIRKSHNSIIVYWWGLWNILDFLFLGWELSIHQLSVLIIIIFMSIFALILLDFDLSEI